MRKESLLKHVIFLGAGASFTSGYPLANDLRLRLSNVRQFIFDFESLSKKTSISVKFSERSICRGYFDQFKDAIEQFRHGGFASIDEFSKLASLKYPALVQDMKQLMWLSLTLHNPELMFEKSDYYPFVQHLFFEEGMPKLKHNVTILSFNYDCYLEYLLLKAVSYRYKLAGIEEPKDGLKNTLASGFFKPSDLTNFHDSIQQLRHFKLHGSMTYADAEAHRGLFATPLVSRLKTFTAPKEKLSMPPIVFPWEIFDRDGAFINESDFIFVREAKGDSQKREAATLYKLYKTIWEGAKEAVQNAHKISFVGMSMHSYLTQGLSFLFQGRTRTAEVVVANTENKDFKDSRIRLHPASPCGRVAEVLQIIAPKMKFVRSSTEVDGVFRYGEAFDANDSAKQPETDITPRYSFGDFIEKELA